MRALPSTAAGSRRAAGRCRSCPPPRSSTSSTSGGESARARRRAAPRCAAAMAAPRRTAPDRSVGAGRGATRRQVARRRARGAGRPRLRERARRRRRGRRARGGERGRRRVRRRRSHDRGLDAPPDRHRRFPSARPFEEDDQHHAGGRRHQRRCTKLECRLLAESAHHGLARAIHPSHTRYDGDIAFAAATGRSTRTSTGFACWPPTSRPRRCDPRSRSIAVTSRAAVEPVSRVLARTATSNHWRSHRSPTSNARRSAAPAARSRRPAPRWCSASATPTPT